ncbi:putative multidrug resistance protein fnx1 [Hypoxylon trugodes]|uniref:putative multidrug resistance protein fnx1 n=1 Tax=Hypoxylon trugodes TaxID=326681 RepID=UPI0021964497|nr:putative multidrug resistance protein fnx1 [Hypoxylon trugodes]KAI1392622.1 putative multidrug resistance protein fnx1 [Hypoxylon trugodes]
MSSTTDPPQAVAPKPGQGWRFWAIFISLTVSSILSALDASAISTAMPSMVKDLGSTFAYIWIANAYFLTMTAFQPLYGQTANIFGRRSLTLLAVLSFAVGSAISGPAPNLGALVAGRAIQGIGGGGINIMIDIVISDLLPLSERPKYMSVIFMAYAIAVALGPIIGGSLSERVTWRWVFYINLPVAAIAFVMLLFSLRVRYEKDTTKNSLKRVDFSGNLLLIAAVVAILLALTWGGVEYPWSAWQTLVPLILGFAGIVAFLVVEGLNLVPEPTMPLRLFSNRTSLACFGLTFLHSILMYWQIYFLPLYFQSALEASPITSGVYLLPTVIICMTFTIIAGIGLGKFGRYRPWHFIGFAFLAIGFGLFSRLDENSSKAYWAGTQCIGAIGIGVLTTTTLPAVQAPLPESDAAVSVGTWAFVRSFGGVWGVAIPAAIFNSMVNSLVGRLDDPHMRDLLSNGGAYSLASGEFISSLNYDPALKDAVKGIYTDSLARCWQVGIAFALLGFLMSLVVKEIPLRTNLETKFGLEESDSKDAEKGAGTGTESPGSGGEALIERTS